MAGAEHDVFAIDRRKAAVTVVAALLLLAGAVALVGQVASWDEILRALRKANRLWFPLCLLGELFAYAGYIAAYRDVARAAGGPKLDVWTATRIAGLGFGAFVVGSAGGTLAADYWALHRAGERPHAAARRVLALNTYEWALLALFAVLAAILVLAGRGEGAPLGMTIGWLVVFPSCAFAAWWVSTPRRARRLAALPHGEPPLRKDVRSWPRWLAHKARAAFADAVGSVVLLRHILVHPLRYPGGLVGFPLYWAGDMLALYAALRAFDARIALAPLVLAYATAYVLTALPLPAGGAGGVEAGLAFTLHAVGVELAPAILAALVYRFFTLWLPIAPALLLLPQARVLARELPRVERDGRGSRSAAQVGLE